MKLQRAAFRIHRWLSYAALAQMLAWICGGVVFSLLPFESVVKGGATVGKPVSELPADWGAALTAATPDIGAVSKVESFASPFGAAFRVDGDSVQVFVVADGSAWQEPDSACVAKWARSLYRGNGALARVSRVERDGRRAGIVIETGDRRDLWQASFADRLHTRFYFDGPSGEFLFVRNDAWVLYDFFFRLHVMDYAGGENFNNVLLRVFALLSFVFALSGAVLTISAARRALRTPTRWRMATDSTNGANRALR